MFYTRPVWGLNGPVRVLFMPNGRADTRIPAHQVEPVAISDGRALANGGALPGPSPPPAADFPLGSRMSTDASGSALRLREEGAAEATTPALTELAAVVTDGAPPRTVVPPRGAT